MALRPPIGRPTPGLYQAPAPAPPAPPGVMGPFSLGGVSGGGMRMGGGPERPAAGLRDTFSDRFMVGHRPGTFGEFVTGPMARAAGLAMGPLGFMGQLGVDLIGANRPGAMQASAIPFGLGSDIAEAVDSAFGTGRPAARGIGGYGGSTRSMNDPGVAGVPGGLGGRGSSGGRGASGRGGKGTGGSRGGGGGYQGGTGGLY